MTTTYHVTRKSDGQQVYEYRNETPLDMDLFPFALFEHTAQIDPEMAPADTRLYGGRRVLTPVEFLRLFTPAERVAIRTAAKTNGVLEDYMALIDAAPEIHLDDHDVLSGVHMLEQAGLIATGRATIVLNG